METQLLDLRYYNHDLIEFFLVSQPQNYTSEEDTVPQQCWNHQPYRISYLRPNEMYIKAINCNA